MFTEDNRTTLSSLDTFGDELPPTLPTAPRFSDDPFDDLRYPPGKPADQPANSGEGRTADRCVCSLEEKHHCCAPDHDQTEPDQGAKVTIDVKQGYVVAKGCKGRYCKECCTSSGIKLRERLREQIKDWKSCLMVTLTVDPKLFENGQAAYLRVRERRALSRLVRSLVKSGHLVSDRYFWVIEFQQNGSPHWHVLLETTFCPIERIQELWDRNRPEGAGPIEHNRPGFGFCWISKSDFASMEHAANYATKYCTKPPDHGYPEWVLDFVGRVPKYSTSRGFWGEGEAPVVQESSCFCSICRGEAPTTGFWKEMVVPREEFEWAGRDSHLVETLDDGLEKRLVWFPGEVQKTPQKRAATIRERLAKCSTVGSIVVQRVQVITAPGERPQVVQRWSWLGYLNMPFAEYCEGAGVEGKKHAVDLAEAERLAGKDWFGSRDEIGRESYEKAEERRRKRKQDTASNVEWPG